MEEDRKVWVYQSTPQGWVESKKSAQFISDINSGLEHKFH